MFISDTKWTELQETFKDSPEGLVKMLEYYEKINLPPEKEIYVASILDTKDKRVRGTICPYCHTFFIPTKEHKIYCCNLHQALSAGITSKNPKIIIKCVQCKTYFKPKRDWQIFCSTPCRILHNNAVKVERVKNKQLENEHLKGKQLKNTKNKLSH